MKRNLLPGLFLISALALSSCSVTNKLAGTDNTGDDVYYTKAKAGDEIMFANNYYTQQPNNYTPDDDYYYYGDYASRINRFNYNTPFDYDDDFYYGYTPYTTSTIGGNINSGYNYGYTPNYNFVDIYSPYDYGYYDFGGYDNFGYGNLYSSYLFSGGGGRSRSRHYNRPGYGGGNGGSLTFTRTGAVGVSRPGYNRGGITNSSYTGKQTNSIIYPGRPDNTTYPRNPAVNNTRIVRPDRDITRQNTPQPERTFTPSQSSPSNSGGGSSGSSGNGGGGRPVRP